MDEFCELLPVFDSYFRIAVIFNEKCNELILNPREGCWNKGARWCGKIDLVLQRLSVEQKDEIFKIFKKNR